MQRSVAKVPPPHSQPWPGPPKNTTARQTLASEPHQGGGLDLKAQPRPLPFPAPRHPAAHLPARSIHRDAAGTWRLLRVAERGTAQRPGERPNWMRDPMEPPGRPSGTTSCFLNPTSHRPKALTCSRAGCQRWEPPWPLGYHPAKPVCRCHSQARASSTVPTVPNNATGPWQRERQARHKSFSETDSKSALR